MSQGCGVETASEIVGKVLETESPVAGASVVTTLSTEYGVSPEDLFVALCRSRQKVTHLRVPLVVRNLIEQLNAELPAALTVDVESVFAQVELQTEADVVSRLLQAMNTDEYTRGMRVALGVELLQRAERSGIDIDRRVVLKYLKEHPDVEGEIVVELQSELSITRTVTDIEIADCPLSIEQPRETPSSQQGPEETQKNERGHGETETLFIGEFTHPSPELLVDHVGKGKKLGNTGQESTSMSSEKTQGSSKAAHTGSDTQIDPGRVATYVFGLSMSATDENPRGGTSVTVNRERVERLQERAENGVLDGTDLFVASTEELHLLLVYVSVQLLGTWEDPDQAGSRGQTGIRESLIAAGQHITTALDSRNTEDTLVSTPEIAMGIQLADAESSAD